MLQEHAHTCAFHRVGEEKGRGQWMFFQESWLCCAVLWVLCCAVLLCAMLCCVVLCCAVSCCAVLCCAVLCCCAALISRSHVTLQDKMWISKKSSQAQIMKLSKSQHSPACLRMQMLCFVSFSERHIPLLHVSQLQLRVSQSFANYDSEANTCIIANISIAS